MQKHSYFRERQILAQIHGKKRETVQCNPVNVENYEPPSFPKSEAERKFIDDALGENFIFAHLTGQERESLIDAMEKEVVPRGTPLFRQGRFGDYFYIVAEGKVVALVNNLRAGIFNVGDSFGEMALLYNSPRASTCLAVTECTLYKVDQSTFRHILASHHDATHKDLREILVNIPMFEHLGTTNMTKFLDALTTAKFLPRERIVTKGDAGEVFYIIQEGSVKVHDIGLGDSQYENQLLTAGDYFGERALLTGEPRAANVTAVSDTTCLCLSRETFELVFGSLEQMMDRGMKKRFLGSVPIFANSNFSDHEMDLLTDVVTEQCYRKGEKLCEAGKAYRQELWIIRHGKVLVTNKKGKLFNLRTGDYFGDKSIKGDPGHISSHTAIMEENTTCWVLTRKDIEDVTGDIGRLGEFVPFTHANVNKSLRLKDLNMLKVLGEGGFGKVWLVTSKRGQRPFALKQMDKRQLIQQRQVQNTRREKDIMFSVEHPFLLQLVSSFQDENNLYLLLELLQGGDLFTRLKDVKGGLDVNEARFYTACIIEALGHFHQRSIVYRDLKPENVMVRRDGYCTIIDFGFAKVVADKTYTLCGTPEYLAPELIMSKGHNKAVDYWAFGVLLYELLVGESAFFPEASDQHQLFKNIVMVKYSVPDTVDADARDLIEKLLMRSPAARLGNQAGGHKDIENHPFYQNITFKKLLRKQIKAPWVPVIKDALDSSYFKKRALSVPKMQYNERLTDESQALFTGF